MRPRSAAPPEIIKPEDKNIKLTEGGRVTLPCVVTGIPDPSVRWTKNGELIDENGNGRYSFSGNSLTIIDTEGEDEGNYTCNATNTHGQDLMVLALRIGMSCLVL